MRALGAVPPADTEAFIAQARWLGIELGTGAVAICAQRAPDDEFDALPSVEGGLLVDVGDGRVLGVVPLDATPPSERRAEALATELSARSMTVALSARRRHAVSLHDALREAELMLELARQPEAMLARHPETYRLLIGILLRDPETLEDLRASTVSLLGRYDSEHDTDLLATLQAFLAHDGSTTETAEALHLHRHTVGYRLTRVHEVSGLSLYESGGRERLSLGLKAHYILEAGSRRPNHA
jgi:sugar diacid utilization regulator